MDNNIFLKVKDLRSKGLSFEDIFDQLGIQPTEYEKKYIECSTLYNEKKYIEALNIYQKFISDSNLYPTLGLYIFDRVYDSYEKEKDLLYLIDLLNTIAEVIPSSSENLKDLYLGISSDFAYYISTIDKKLIKKIKLLYKTTATNRIKHLKRCPVVDFKDRIEKPKSDRAVCVVIANDYARSQYKLTKQSVVNYAKKCNADYIELTGDQSPLWPMANKYRIHAVTSVYDKTLYVDCDVLIKDHAPDIFKYTPNDKLSIVNEYYEIGEDYKKEVDNSKRIIAEILDIDKYYNHDIVPNCGVMVIPKCCADLYKQPKKSYPMDWCFDQNYLSITTEPNDFYLLNTYPMNLFNSCASHSRFLNSYKQANFVHCNIQPQEYRTRMLELLISNKLNIDNIYPTEDEKNKNSYFETSWHKQPTISFIVACKDRYYNLLKSLKSWVDSKKVDEIIIVDFSSAKPLSKCKEIKKIIDSDDRVKLIRVDGESFFNLGKANNIGFDYCTSDLVAKMDCDYFLKDDSWINDILYQYKTSGNNYFFTGSYEFSESLSGFSCMPRNETRFREDLNGWGYDEIDFYKRIKADNPSYEQITWFDINRSVTHLPHKEDERTDNYKIKFTTESNFLNAQICEQSVTANLSRNKYKQKNGVITFTKKKKPSKIFCINLESDKNNWKKLKDIDTMERFPAVDSRFDREVYKKYNLEINPVDISQGLYLHYNLGAIGCFLSHYSCWKKIVDENLEYAMIIEDDLCPLSVVKIQNSNLIINDYDLINLSPRIYSPKENKHLFFGGESYIISRTFAQFAINSVQNARPLDGIDTFQFLNVRNLIADNKIKDEPKWPRVPSISCAVDRFLGHLCELKSTNWFHYPMSEMTDNQKQSSINGDRCGVWNLPEDRTLDMIQQLYPEKCI